MANAASSAQIPEVMLGSSTCAALKKSLERVSKSQNLTISQSKIFHWSTLTCISSSSPSVDLMPMDFKGVWAAMEESQRPGLTKSIGVSNFSSKKIETSLSFATIPPSVNQKEEKEKLFEAAIFKQVS
ncbi:unnamed protein product [Prunus armeniaca]|uniref:NADP-dependent oxidoreductase domain-containing protein n=1 Tax=Prunus armeniaca TaxID=36596 RepID=A0A6J5VLZ7_PRUAR|nr:unnamed protein product [Prunus armeniaca]